MTVAALEVGTDSTGSLAHSWVVHWDCVVHTHERAEVCFNNSGAGLELPVMETNIIQLWECALELGLVLFLHLGRAGAPEMATEMVHRDGNSRERLRSSRATKAGSHFSLCV